jgi:hypothetical protein
MNVSFGLDAGLHPMSGQSRGGAIRFNPAVTSAKPEISQWLETKGDFRLFVHRAFIDAVRRKLAACAPARYKPPSTTFQTGR